MSAVTAASDSFAEFLAKLRNRDDEAAREVFQRFAARLIGLARQRVTGSLKNKVDPEDVVQSAYKSFFHRYGGRELEAVDWNNLWGLLALITIRKCVERVAYHRAQCRDARREAASPAD